MWRFFNWIVGVDGKNIPKIVLVLAVLDVIVWLVGVIGASYILYHLIGKYW